MKELEERLLQFDFDRYYKQQAEKLKKIEKKEEWLIQRKEDRKQLQDFLALDSLKWDIEEIRKEFLNIILSENATTYLWVCNSYYVDKTYTKNYLDKISPIFRKMNQVAKGGINDYKINGWMTHICYVFQILNYNIAKGKCLKNFEGNQEEEKIKKDIQELHKIYHTLDNTFRFILKIFALIHDIGVIEEVEKHAQCGAKYVEEVLQEIGLTEEFLIQRQIPISLADLIIVLKDLIRYHIIYATLSGEGSDQYTEQEYQRFLDTIPETIQDKRQISSLLYLFTNADVIAVNEIIYNQLKYERLLEAYHFFNETIDHQPHNREIKQVAMARIADFVGLPTVEGLEEQIENMLHENQIDIGKFWRRMYEIAYFNYFQPVMKEIKDLSLTVKTLHYIFELLETKLGEGCLKKAAITWVPNKNEKRAGELIRNGDIFECMQLLTQSNENKIEWKDIKIEITNTDKIYLKIQVIEK